MDTAEDTQMVGIAGEIFYWIIDVEVEIKKAGGNKKSVEGPWWAHPG